MSYDPDIELTRIGSQNGNLLFYPSSGTDCKWLSDYNYDVLVMADYYPRTQDARHQFWQEFSRNMGGDVSLIASTVRTRVFRIGNKRGFLFFQDNNEVLERIQNSGSKIACFVGVCDGCREGGNYECVNDLKFMTKVLSLADPRGMVYITDHSELLFPMPNLWNCPPPEPYQEFILGDKRFHYTRSLGRTAGYGPVVKYDVSYHEPTVYTWENRHLQVTIEHDSICNHLKELDGALVSKRCKHLCEFLDPLVASSTDIEIVPQHYFKPSKLAGWSSGQSLHHLLRICDQRRWKSVGTTAFGEGRHTELIGILQNWTRAFPKLIRLFYFDSQDLVEFRERFCKDQAAGYR